MTPKTRKVVLSVGLATLLVGCGKVPNMSDEMNHDTAHANPGSAPDSLPDDPVHTIVMPHDEPLLPPGPGREEFVTACVVCHSPRYITMQPRFSRSTWLGEVNKMKNVYGGHISDEQVSKIIDYLVFLNGGSEGDQAAKGASYGE